MIDITSNLETHPDSAGKPLKPNTDNGFGSPDYIMNEFLRRGSMGLDIASVEPELQYKLLERNDLAFKLTSTKCYIYPNEFSSYHAKKRNKKSDENLQKQNYSGYLTTKTKNKIKTKLDVWVELIKLFNSSQTQRFQRKRTFTTFATLTLPVKQFHSDKEINKKCLTPFFDKIKYHFAINNYFWRAERQENGNIHYHILFDTFINKEELQNLWNNTIAKLGYIKKFALLHKHTNPPTTNIKALPANSSAISYLVKYALKTEKQDKIHGRVWLCSKALLKLQAFSSATKVSLMILFNYLFKHKLTKIFERDYNLLITFPSLVLSSAKHNIVIDQYRQYLLMLYHILYRDRHKDDSSYKFYQTTPLDIIDMEYFGNLRRLHKTQ